MTVDSDFLYDEPYDPLDDAIYASWHRDIHNVVPALGLSSTHARNNASLLSGNVTWRGALVGDRDYDPVTGLVTIRINLDRLKDDAFRFSPHGNLSVTNLKI